MNNSNNSVFEKIECSLSQLKSDKAFKVVNEGTKSLLYEANEREAHIRKDRKLKAFGSEWVFSRVFWIDKGMGDFVVLYKNNNPTTGVLSYFDIE